MQTINRFSLLGNVGSIKAFNNVTKVSIATNRTWRDENGERQTRTDWTQVTVFQEQRAKWINDTLNKGDMVYVEGYVSDSSYGEGADRKFTTDLIATVFNRWEA